MDILNTMKSAFGGDSNPQQNNLISSLLSLIGGQSGGLQGLISRFESKGLGDVVNSWVSTGDNKPISPDQVHTALGDETVNTLAAKTGMDTGTVKSQLAQVLPQMIDKLTPDGKVPEGDILSKGLGMLGGMFGNR